MKKMKRVINLNSFPDVVLVEMTNDGEGNWFPIANEEKDIDNFSDNSIVGVYKLVETKKVVKKTELI